MNDQEQRLRNTEIEVATIKSSLKSIESKVQLNNTAITEIKENIKESNRIMDKWDGGVTLLTKAVFLLCTVIGATIAVANYLST